MVQQRINQSMLFMAASRVNNQSRRFVQYEQRFVFKQDIQGHLLRLRLCRARFGPMDLDLFAGPRGMGWLDRAAIDADVALLDQPLDRPA